MKICLVRHGETDWNAQMRVQGRENVPLNNNGKHQAEQLGQVLSLHKWGVVISSPLSRAYDTAVIISKSCGLTNVMTLPSLTERNFGEVSGTTYGDDYWEKFKPDAVGLESEKALEERAFASLSHIVTMYSDKDIVVVSHGGTINALLYRLSGGQIGSGITWLKNACINLIIFNNYEFKIIFHNKGYDEVSQCFPFNRHGSRDCLGESDLRLGCGVN